MHYQNISYPTSSCPILRNADFRGWVCAVNYVDNSKEILHMLVWDTSSRPLYIDNILTLLRDPKNVIKCAFLKLCLKSTANSGYSSTVYLSSTSIMSNNSWILKFLDSGSWSLCAYVVTKSMAFRCTWRLLSSVYWWLLWEGGKECAAEFPLLSTSIGPRIWIYSTNGSETRNWRFKPCCDRCILRFPYAGTIPNTTFYDIAKSSRVCSWNALVFIYTLN